MTDWKKLKKQCDAKWEEGKHKRDKSGKFTSGGGGGGESKSEKNYSKMDLPFGTTYKAEKGSKSEAKVKNATETKKKEKWLPGTVASAETPEIKKGPKPGQYVNALGDPVPAPKNATKKSDERGLTEMESYPKKALRPEDDPDYIPEDFFFGRKINPRTVKQLNGEIDKNKKEIQYYRDKIGKITDQFKKTGNSSYYEMIGAYQDEIKKRESNITATIAKGASMGTEYGPTPYQKKHGY